MQVIDRIARNYGIQSALILTMVTALFLLAGMHLSDGISTVAVVVCCAFSIIIESADILIWHHVAKKSPDMLTTFYSAASGFRMLAVLAVMFGYYIAVGEGMLSFLMVLAVYYIALLAHHTIFFARLTNNSGELKK